jgi:hypothetical protein
MCVKITVALWYSWKYLFKAQDKTDRESFYASTVIFVENGKLTPFFEAR